MARLSHIVVPGYPHHVTQRGIRSMDVFHSEEDSRMCLGMLGEDIGRPGVSSLVWCLMTNHVHFVAVPLRLIFDSVHLVDDCKWLKSRCLIWGHMRNLLKSQDAIFYRS